MVNFPINLRCYVLLGCRVINVILAINIGDSAFFDIAALVRQFGCLRHHQQTESIHWPPPNQNPGYATASMTIRRCRLAYGSMSFGSDRGTLLKLRATKFVVRSFWSISIIPLIMTSMITSAFIFAFVFLLFYSFSFTVDPTNAFIRHSLADNTSSNEKCLSTTSIMFL